MWHFRSPLDWNITLKALSASVGCYSVTNRNEAPIHAKTWISVEKRCPIAADEHPPAPAPLRRPWRTQFQSPGRPSGCRLYGFPQKTRTFQSSATRSGQAAVGHFLLVGESTQSALSLGDPGENLHRMVELALIGPEDQSLHQPGTDVLWNLRPEGLRLGGQRARPAFHLGQLQGQLDGRGSSVTLIRREEEGKECE
uniref:uncharacterized protein LOC118537248 isoform X2 n=1 Tax=Halichoerus grypus TaxID=9711 RepID=UPI001658D2B8|nr:uncharacterized protein LOC118537248 isoform X2 [Halichoerus grypus]